MRNVSAAFTSLASTAKKMTTASAINENDIYKSIDNKSFFDIAGELPNRDINTDGMDNAERKMYSNVNNIKSLILSPTQDTFDYDKWNTAMLDDSNMTELIDVDFIGWSLDHIAKDVINGLTSKLQNMSFNTDMIEHDVRNYAELNMLSGVNGVSYDEFANVFTQKKDDYVYDDFDYLYANDSKTGSIDDFKFTEADSIDIADLESNPLFNLTMDSTMSKEFDIDSIGENADKCSPIIGQKMLDLPPELLSGGLSMFLQQGNNIVKYFQKG